ncbi:HAD hydrolase family protein, partial [Acinetobacter baumannii]|uniref:HAD hydrolase family protein n=1 Tax=Acinetobacter baumannii TaxID=470 RepID=UPI001AECADFE
PETKDAIKKLQRHGHMVMVATGRSLPIAEEILEESGIEHSILSNGAVAFVEGKQIYGNPLDETALEKLVQISDERKIDLVFNGLTKTKLRNKEFQIETKLAMESFGENMPEVDKDFYKTEKIYQVVALLGEDKMSAYETKFTEFRFVRWHEFGIDIL